MLFAFRSEQRRDEVPTEEEEHRDTEASRDVPKRACVRNEDE